VRQYIFEVRKLIPAGVCKKVLDLFDDDYQDAPVSGDKEGDELKEIRNCVAKDLFNNTNSLGKTILVKHLNFIISSAVNSYKQKYPYFSYDKVSELTLLKYEHNKHKAGYVYHTDTSYKTPKRSLSCSIALNNDYEGGEFEFDIEGQIYSYPQNIGDCIIFPSNFMFPHTITQITKGTRNALISWIV
jgi:predicted 2-oxoglutarate/Fe(II)-dependent dioxygenase YbiX